MGRLIPNQNAVHTSLVHCNDENEFLQLRYQLGDRVLNIDFDEKIITYATEVEKKLRGAYHIHAYILDYQQIEFATKAMSVPFSTILKVKVDCLVLQKPTIDSRARELHEYSKGAWDIDAIIDWMLTMEHIPITELKPFKGWEDSQPNGLDVPYKWAGFHEERGRVAHPEHAAAGHALHELEMLARGKKCVPAGSEHCVTDGLVAACPDGRGRSRSPLRGPRDRIPDEDAERRR